MYRTNAQSRALEESFMRYGIQYRLVGGTRFYARREVKDIVATCGWCTILRLGEPASGDQRA